MGETNAGSDFVSAETVLGVGIGVGDVVGAIAGDEDSAGWTVGLVGAVSAFIADGACG